MRTVERSRHRAEVTAGADQQRRADRLVDDPRAAMSARMLVTGVPSLHACAGALQQVVVELAAPDAEADRLAVRGLDVLAAPPMSPTRNPVIG